MRHQGFKALGILLLHFALVSCNLDSLKDPVVVAEVNNEFHIDLWENLSPFGNSLQFNIQTIEEYNCKNYTIDFNLVPKFREISISLNDIQEPGDCEQGTNPAQAGINLGSLAAGFYELNIDLKNTVFNQGQLTVSSERYVIEMEETNGISFLRRELFRIPAQTIWGYVAYDSSSESVADDFIQRLGNISQAKNLQKGYYGHFILENDNSSKIIIPQLSITENFKTFLFHFDGQEGDLANLVDQFRENYGQSIQISLTNDKGNVF